MIEDLFVCTVYWGLHGSLLGTKVVAVIAASDESAKFKARNWFNSDSDNAGYEVNSVDAYPIVL